METFLNILEVLGTTPSDFLKEKAKRKYYIKSERTIYDEYDRGYILNWVVPSSNEYEMEPLILTIKPGYRTNLLNLLNLIPLFIV